MFRCHPTRSSVMERTFLLLVLVVVGVVFVGGQTLPIRRPTLLVTVNDSRRGGSPSLLSLCGWPGLQCRGGGGEGGSFHKGGGAIELNPAFQGNNPSFKNEHEEWLQQQQEQQEPYDTLFHQHSSVPIPRNRKLQDSSSIVSNITNYFVTLHHNSPSLCWTMISCLTVFGMWQVSRFTKQPNSILSLWFVNSRYNTRRTLGASLLLSSLSHMAPYHLVINLMALGQFGPRVQQLLQQSPRRRRSFVTTTPHGNNVPLWPLLVSSAIVSNLAQIMLTNRPGGGSSLGLSGVTMALSAVQARAEPTRRFAVLLGGVFPISLQAHQMLLTMILLSLGGHLMTFLPQHRGGSGGNNIAHMAHLGGLLFGIVYYECAIRGSTPRQLLYQGRRWMAQQTWQKWG
jgi:membrane associated rhomboid family serine protease